MSLMLITAVLTATVTPKLLSFRPNLELPSTGQVVELSYYGVSPETEFTEVIPSWNVEHEIGRAHV